MAFTSTPAKADLSSYNFHDLNIRVLLDDQHEPLFCLVDVAKALKFDGTYNLTRQIKEEFTGAVLNTAPVKDENNHVQPTTFITEPQLYFVMMRSRSKIARQFRQWICNEVIPAIRKTGSYAVKEAPAQAVPDDPTALGLPDFRDPVKAAIAWADLKLENNQVIQERDNAIQERDEAVKTKAQIGSRREATAMATAAKAVKETEDLTMTLYDVQDRLNLARQMLLLTEWQKRKAIEALNKKDEDLREVKEELKKYQERESRIILKKSCSVVRSKRLDKYSTIKEQAYKLKKIFDFEHHKDAVAAISRELVKLSIMFNMPFTYVDDDEYGTAPSFRRDIWQIFYARRQDSADPLKEYRLQN